MRLDPSDGMLLVYRSQCWSGQGDHDRAIADASEAIRIEPTLAWAYLVRSKHWERKEKFDRALDDASAGVRLNPTSPTAYLVRAIARMYATPDSHHNLNAALADCDEAARLVPQDPAIHLIRGIVLANKGEFGSAFRDVVFHPLLRNSTTRVNLITIEQ